VGVYGQDWSSFQSTTLPTTGLGFAVVKQTEGLTYTNPNAAGQVAHARANKLIVGHYHYPHMANSPAAEADRFLAVSKRAAGDFLVLDWEGYDKSNDGVPFSTQVAYKKAWLAHVQAAVPHLQTGTYANTNYLNRDLAGAYGDFLWIATADRPAGQPGISHKWLFHQYGASGIDRDYCPLTLAALKAWTHAKENPEDDVAWTDRLTIAKGPWSDKAQTATAEDWLMAGNLKAGAAVAGVQALTAQVGALTKLVAEMATALAKGGGLTAEQAEAAATAGAQAALAELGHALDGANPTT